MAKRKQSKTERVRVFAPTHACRHIRRKQGNGEPNRGSRLGLFAKPASPSPPVPQSAVQVGNPLLLNASTPRQP